MRQILSLSLLSLLIAFSCDNLDLATPVAACKEDNSTFNYDRADQLQNIADKYSKLGIPGIAIAVKTETGEWAGASGYAKIEDKTPLQTCHILYSQSVTKTYGAVLIMMLHEEGRIDLDATINQYLPDHIAKRIKGSDKVTVRNLLNHTSGIHDYTDANYITDVLNNQDKIFSVEHFLSYAYDKDLEFEPGTKYQYTNTNYVLLMLMIDNITGIHHSVMMTERIFKPLGLQNTFYKNESGYMHYPEQVNVYFDRRSIGKLENVTQSQINIHYPLIGDDGVIATSLDLVRFLDALIKGKLVKPETLDLMRTWVNNDKGEPAYGLGLSYLSKYSVDGYGHSGGGLGSGCILYYFPERNTTLFIGINVGTFLESPITDHLDEMVKEVVEIL